MFTRIQWRIAASYVVLSTLVLLGLGLYLVNLLREQQLEALEDQLERQARLVAVQAQRRIPTEGTVSLDPLTKQLGRAALARITLIAADGTVLGDSEYDPATMDNHATRPEVRQALQQGSGAVQRRSATVEQDLLYVAVPIEQDGAILGVARVALPLTAVQQASRQLIAAVAGALAAAVLLAIIVAVVSARVTTGPIQRLTRAARALAAGDLDHELPIEGRDEVSLLGAAFNEMAARVQRHIRAVEDERGRLAAVLRHMPNGLLMTDGNGMVQMINPAAAELLQTTQSQAEGRSVIAVVRHHELAALVDQALTDNTAMEQPHLVELGPPRQRRIVQALASRLPGIDYDHPQALLILQDVTEVRRAESLRREFVANVSHELRTPVASLKALVETLASGALEDVEVAHDFLARMHVEIDGLAQLVGELLELSRIESGQVALRLQPLDLAAVVAITPERLRPQAERLGLCLTVDRPTALPMVRADAERIRQVVINLVHNAIKFTPPRGRVSVSVEQRDGALAVVVTDSGVGIAAEALPRLFERFYKADSARAGGGTGLGLAIAKHLVHAHGGRIWAESAGEGTGAIFTFTLPIPPTSSNA